MTASTPTAQAKRNDRRSNRPHVARVRRHSTSRRAPRGHCALKQRGLSCCSAHRAPPPPVPTSAFTTSRVHAIGARNAGFVPLTWCRDDPAIPGQEHPNEPSPSDAAGVFAGAVCGAMTVRGQAGFDRPGARLCQCAGPQRRSARLRRSAANATIAAAPGASPIRARRARGDLLAEEQRHAGQGGQLLRLRRARRRRGRAQDRAAGIFDRSQRRRLPVVRCRPPTRPEMSAPSSVRPTANAAPSPICGPAMAAHRRAAF